MPTHVLEGDKPVTLPAKPVTFRISGAGGVELNVFIDGRADARALRPTADKVIVPVVDQPLVVRATPSGGGTFASSTVISCTAEIEVRGDHDPERAVLAQVDLSGLTGRDLIEVVPDGPRLRLTSMGVVTQTELPELAAAARDAAREVLGAERAPREQRTALTILVDCSASMRPLMEEGSLASAVEVVVGVAQVMNERVAVRLAGERATDLPEVPVAELGRATSDAALAQPLAGSVRLDPVGRGRTCVISDQVLGDGAGAHWLVLVPESAQQALGARPDTSFAPVPAWGNGVLAETLLRDRQKLGALVRGLVSGLAGVPA